MRASYKKGEVVIVGPTGSDLQASYPAANWLNDHPAVKMTGRCVVQLQEDAVEGTVDVFNVKTTEGKDCSIYGFNILRSGEVK